MAASRRKVHTVWRQKRGHAPGVPVHVPGQSRVWRMIWDEQHYRLDELPPAAFMQNEPEEGFAWWHIRGGGDEAILELLRGRGGVGPLVLEDLANGRQRPKCEEHGALRVLVLRHHGLAADDPEGTPFFLLAQGNRLISVGQEPPSTGILRRLENPESRLRRNGIPYLVYALLDDSVDHLMARLEEMEEKLLRLEEGLEGRNPRDPSSELHEQKVALGLLLRTMNALRPAVRQWMLLLSLEEQNTLNPFLQDLLDHVQNAREVAETIRQQQLALQEFWMALLGMRLNEVMRHLALISTLFIPLSFLAGLYGMNFRHMPELEWPWAYPVVLITMGGCMLGMLAWFRRKGWLGASGGRGQAAAVDGRDGGGRQDGH